MGFLFFHFIILSFQKPKMSFGEGGGGGRGEKIADGGGEAWERWTADGDGDGEAPTCSKWVGFPRLFFPSCSVYCDFLRSVNRFHFFGDL